MALVRVHPSGFLQSLDHRVVADSVVPVRMLYLVQEDMDRAPDSGSETLVADYLGLLVVCHLRDLIRSVRVVADIMRDSVRQVVMFVSYVASRATIGESVPS